MFFMIFLLIKGNTMSVLLRSMLVLSLTSLFVVGCGKKEEAPVEAAPAPVAAPAVVAPAPVVDTNAGGGGYVPTAEERVPGITVAVDAAPVAEAAPAAVAEPAAK